MQTVSSANSTISKRLRLLIVDANPADRSLIKAMIQQEQYEILEAATGKDGIELAREFKLDCAIVAQTLPDVQGTEIFDDLRAATCDADLPIIMFTGLGEELLAVEAMHSGAADYLPKQTLSPVALETALTNALTQAKLRRELNEERLRIIAINQQLIRANEELCSFHETVARQLKTPLAAIKELTSMTLEGKGGPLTQEQKEYLGASLTSCDRLAHMIDGLVDTAKVETSQLPYNLQPCNINPIVHDQIELLSPAAAAAGITIETNLSDNLPDVSADSVRIGQLVTNLVANAIKFTDPGGLISVCTQVDTTLSQVSLSVRDTGRGISPQFVDKIFERFAQTRIEDSEFHQGMGIGLYICSDIARNHQGHLQVDSELASGSKFIFTLPVPHKSAVSLPVTAA